MNATDKLVYETKSKLMPKTSGPFQVLQATLDTVTIDEDGIPNTVSLDRVTLAPSRMPQDTTSDVNTTKKGRENAPARDNKCPSPTSPTPDDANKMTKDAKTKAKGTLNYGKKDKDVPITDNTFDKPKTPGEKEQFPWTNEGHRKNMECLKTQAQAWTTRIMPQTLVKISPRTPV